MQKTTNRKAPHPTVPGVEFNSEVNKWTNRSPLQDRSCHQKEIPLSLLQETTTLTRAVHAILSNRDTQTTKQIEANGGIAHLFTWGHRLHSHDANKATNHGQNSADVHQNVQVSSNRRCRKSTTQSQVHLEPPINEPKIRTNSTKNWARYKINYKR